MSLGPGDRFDRYEILAVLGKGGMGEVYAAYDGRLHRRVALKLLRPPRAEDDPSVAAARMLREARAAAGIAHPNAVAIYDVGDVDGVPYLAMEIVSGRTLRTYVNDDTVPMPRRVRWLVDVARALGAAHELRLVHRDIKPENIMIRSDGVVKVLDFGIARRTKESAVDPTAPTRGATLGTLTRDGVVVGTPFYMAPEQMRGDPLDERADQFAWGVVAYELLTGRLPWNAELGELSLVAQILTQNVAPLRDRNPEVPKDVDAVVCRTLAKAPLHRFPSIDDAADAIEAFADNPSRRSSKRPEPQAPAPSLAETAAGTAEGAGHLSTRGQFALQQPSLRPARRARVLGVSLIGALLAGVVAWRVARAPTKAPMPAPASPSASPALATPSSNLEAATAFTTAVRAFRDASTATAATSLERALRLDPAFPLAHLERALLETVTDQSTTVLQDELRQARVGRDSLGARDRVLLDALEPWVSTPPDLPEARRRIEAAARNYPTDAEFEFEYGEVLDQMDDRNGAIAAAHETLARDPTFALAWELVAYAREADDDVDGAVQAETECLKLSPGGDTCLWSLARIQRGRGQCKELIGTSRRILALLPDSAQAYRYLAGALAATGEPLDAVASALEQVRERTSRDIRSIQALIDDATVAVLAGDLVLADRRYEALERAESGLMRQYPHFLATAGRMMVDLELGREDAARRDGASFLRRRSSWIVDPGATDHAIGIYSLLLASGGVDRSSFDTRREEWLREDTDRRRVSGLIAAPDYVWALAYADPSQTKEDAVSALAARDAGARPFFDVTSSSPDLDEAIGRTYALAGRLEEATPFLRRAANSCATADVLMGIPAYRASVGLGEALEAEGDIAGACQAYARVLARWGGAKPLPRTATRARAHALALHCLGEPPKR